MKYLLLAYDVDKQLETMPAGQRETFEAACMANAEWLRQGGRLRVLENFAVGPTARPVRVWKGQVTVPDGPDDGPNQQLVGLFIIRARDLNEAIRLALQMPQANSGPIDVRPIIELD